MFKLFVPRKKFLSVVERTHDALINLVNEIEHISLKLELAEAQVKGITDDRDELQVEHEAVMEYCDRIVEDRETLQGIGRDQDDIIHRVKEDYCRVRQELNVLKAKNEGTSTYWLENGDLRAKIRKLGREVEQLKREKAELMETCNRVLEHKGGLVIKNIKLESDLKHCNDRSEKYRMRSVALNTKLGDIGRVLHGSIR